MDLLSLSVLLAGGCLAGFLGGWFALSEGLVVVPLILAVEHAVPVSMLVSMHVAMGTSLAAIAVHSSVRAYRALKEGQILIQVAVVAGISSALTAGAGSILAGVLDGGTLRIVFAAACIFAALRLLAEVRKPKGEPRLDVPGLVSTGLLSGACTAVTGVSGALVAQPIFYSFRRIPLAKSVGTSDAVAAVAASASAAGYALMGKGNSFLPESTVGYINPLYLLPILAGLFLCTMIGSRLTPPGPLPRKLLAIALLIVAAKMLFA